MEMNEEYVKRWNRMVSDEDDVYVLGDLMLGDNNIGVHYLSQLNGNIHVVLGNHDTSTRQNIYVGMENIIEIQWAIMLNYKKYHFFMTHFPCMTGNLEKESLKQMTLNLYGHTHQNSNFYEDRPYMYHVGVDSHNGYPVLLDDIIQEMKDKVDECKGFLGNDDSDELHASKEPDIKKVIKATIDNWPEWKKDAYREHLFFSPPAISSNVYPKKNYKINFKKDPPDGGFYG